VSDPRRRPPGARDAPGGPDRGPSPSRRRRPPRRSAADPDIRRTPLGDQGGPVRTAGDPSRAEPLRAALEGASEVEVDDLTHGFHPYPARMHPGVARGVLEGVAAEEGVAAGPVLDPFCGSGTVLVESLRAGRPSLGVDLNPLAIRLCEVRTRLTDPAARDRLLAAAAAVAETSEDRVRGRVPAVAPVPGYLVPRWDAHILKELAGLREEIRDTPMDGETRRALELVFSALVGKFSRRRGDTVEGEAPRRLRKGLPTEFFLRKTRELAERWARLAAEVASPPAPVSAVEGDARRLPELLGRAPRPTLLLSSPPYGGTYDYVAHHELRYPWLGLDPRPLQRDEIGARRHLTRAVDGVRRWHRELGDALTAMARVLHPAGRAVLWIGDARVGGREMPADQQVGELAGQVGLRLVAGASQPRPDRGGRARPPRREHLLLLEPAPRPGRRQRP